MNATTTQTVTVKNIIEPKDLLDFTSARINRRSARAQVKIARRQLSRAKARYAQGTEAEAQSLRALIDATHLECRRTMLRSKGRKIALLGLLSQLRQDGNPLWALVNPLHKIGCSSRWASGLNSNGAYSMAQERSAQYSERPAGYNVLEINGRDAITIPLDLGIVLESGGGYRHLVPSGMPALPPKVRRILSNPKVLKRANWIGVLYQPAEWSKPNPDPALVVEWKDVPGEYYALAIWGGDYHRIMEFVD